MSLSRWLARNRRLVTAVPFPVKNWVRRNFALSAYRQATAQWTNPLAGSEHEWEFQGKSDYRLGIVLDLSHDHHDNMLACREMGVSYRVVDITRHDWIERVHRADVVGFLVRPTVTDVVIKQLFDERLRVMVSDLGAVIFPSLDEIWLYESKRRTRYWLETHGFPSPRTWVFYNEAEAGEFVEHAELPLVFKSDRGGKASGVEIVRSRARGRQLIRTCFGRGYLAYRADPRDRQWGCAIFQEYLGDVREWRLVRVGDSYLCRFKHKVGDFHSGSGHIEMARPPAALLDMTRRITDAGGFRSMNVDYFETTDGRYLVNEMHTVFGAKALADSELNGRYRWDAAHGTYAFERGDFFRNRCANLRVEHLVAMLGLRLPE